MKTTSQLRDLEMQHRQLLQSLTLPDSALGREAPDAFRRLDLAPLQPLLRGEAPLGRDVVFDERARLVTEVFQATDEGRQLHLASEMDLLRKVKESGEDQLHRGPFDILELVLPVKVQGHVLHLVRSGKFRERPFSADDARELGFATGVPAARVQEAASTLPIRADGDLESWVTLHRRLRDVLAALLEEHTRHLGMAQRQVEDERLVALGTMAEGMAHHFSNLLSVILGYTSLVIAKSELSKEAADSLAKVAEAAQKGRRFTEEILTVAGVEEEETASSLHERLRGVVALLQSRQAARIEVDLQLEARHDTVMAPAGVVHQIAFNLVANALDSLRPGARLRIASTNTGEGEATQIRVEVAEIGTRKGASAPATPGVRLASLLGQVARLEGTVSSAAKDESVSRTTVTLPVSALPVAARPEKKVRRRLAPSLIWVADDDPVVREMCRRVLTTEGHTVEEAASGEELRGKLAASREKPDLVVYDFSMPDVDGLEFCEELREAGQRTPVILISGFTGDHPNLKKALKLRKTFLLQKPFSFRDMSDLVTIAMGETLVEG